MERPEDTFTPIHGQIQLMMAVYDRRRGWLVTKCSVIKGGRHGEPALIDLPTDEVVTLLIPEVHAGVRAMQRRWSLE